MQSKDQPGENTESPVQEERRRTRRTYSCGPCKRFKMKCNMELPCRLCVQAKREHECMLLPPNPPSEEEKNRTARRRLRNLRRQELEQQKFRTSTSAPMNSGPSPTSTHGSNVVAPTGSTFSPSNHGSISAASKVPGLPYSPTRALTSPSNPLVVSQVSSRTLLISPAGEQVVVLYMAEQVPQIPVRTHTNVNVNNFAFVMAYAAQCKALTTAILTYTLMQWKNLVATVNSQQVAIAFREHYFWEDGGVHEVMDVSAMLVVAHNMMAELPSLLDHWEWSIDNYSLQQMSFVCILLAKSEALEGSSQRAIQWLEMSREIRDMFAPFALLGDCIYLSQWMIQSKIAFELVNASEEYAVLFESYLATILSCDEFVEQLSLTEQNGPDSDQFMVCARLWVIMKIIEIELSILQSKAGLQNKFPPLQNTIVPDRQLIYRVYGIDFSQTVTNFTPFNQALIASYEFFRLFESATLPRDVIYLYLSLYGRVHSKFHAASDKATALMAGNIDLALISQNSEAIVTSIIVSFLLIRWLSIVQADSPHFPSLRFAHYLSTMMMMFNMFDDIDDRLGLPFGVLVGTLMRGSNIQMIIQIYNGLCHQAMFAAALSCFLQPDSASRTLDLSYVFHVVMKSLTKTLSKMSASPPFSSTPLLATVLQGAEILVNIANDPSAVASSPEQFLELLLATIPADTAACFVRFVFGSPETLQNHLKQLWRLGDYVNAHGHSPIPITSNVVLNTDFLRQFESSYIPFAFTQDIVNDYMTVVVDGNA